MCPKNMCNQENLTLCEAVNLAVINTKTLCIFFANKTQYFHGETKNFSLTSLQGKCLSLSVDGGLQADPLPI